MKKWICVYLISAFSVLGIGIYSNGGDRKTPKNEVIVYGTVVDYEKVDSRGDGFSIYA